MSRVCSSYAGAGSVGAFSYALGPESGGRVLASAVCPEIRLPDLDGREFALSSLRGRKVVLVAWASW